MKEICESCRFWVHWDGTLGSCQVEPPKIIDAMVSRSIERGDVDPIRFVHLSTWFPIVDGGETCGRFERKREG